MSKNQSLLVAPKHDFAAKLRQPSLLPRVKEYIEWQQTISRAYEVGKTPPAPPEWLGPVSINLDLTTACNYHCDHCIDLDILNSRVKYGHERLMASLENMIEMGLRSVILIGGGEPTIYPKFGEVVRFLKKHEMQVAIVSNGSRNHVILGIMDCMSEKDWVRLSLDSGSNMTFIKMHNPVKNITLDEICSWVPQMRERNPVPAIGFSFIIVWDAAKSGSKVNIVSNIDEIVMATKLARAYRFSYISFKPFLTRFSDGAEVMDPSVMEDFKKTVKRIRGIVNEAKGYETEDFKVLESTNLKILYENRWRDFTHQPRVCHMQAFHQVLSPLGLFNCPAWRGIEKGRVAGKDAYFGKEETAKTQKEIAVMLDNFDASRNCANITCLYNSANWWLDKAVKGELDSEELQALVERNDFYF